jgi:hypothetical protein
MKTCTKCKTEKPLDECFVDRSKKSGHTLRCKQCIGDHYYQNVESVLQYHKEYYNRNRAEILKYAKEYREAQNRII